MNEPQETGKTANPDDPIQFYENGAKYWNKVEPTVEGMLGGLGFLTNTDIKASEKFLKDIWKLRNPPGKERALDCGSGIGRISKNLLSRFFDSVDLVDQDPKFIETAKELLKNTNNICNFYCCGLQDFKPEERYDVVWCQWVLCHVADEDLTGLLNRFSAVLKPNGRIVVKENCTRTNESEVDQDDSSVTRSFSKFLDLFLKSGYDVEKYSKQKKFPQELYPVWSFVLRRKVETMPKNS